MFHQFRQAKFAYGGLTVVSLSQLWLLPQLPQKIAFASEALKIDSKTITSLPLSKSVKITVYVKTISAL